MDEENSDQVVPESGQKGDLSTEKPSTPPVSPSNMEGSSMSTTDDTSVTIQKVAEKLSHDEGVPEAGTATTEDYSAYGAGAGQNYDENYPNGYEGYGTGAEYDTSAYGYSGDQTSTTYDPNTTIYGYDQNYYPSSGYDYSNYDPSQYGQTADSAYDPNQAYSSENYDQNQGYGNDYYQGYDYNSGAYGTESGAGAEGYNYETTQHSGTEGYGYDTSQYGAEQAGAGGNEGIYDANQYGTETMTTEQRGYPSEYGSVQADKYGFDPVTGNYSEEHAAYSYSNYSGGDYNTSQYGAPAKEPDPDSWDATTFSQPPPLPSEPLFKSAPTHTPDPFSWEAQESSVPSLPPPRPPPTPAAKSPEPPSDEHISHVDQEKSKAPPPPRPAPPPAEKKQPPRPPAPSPARPPPPSAKTQAKAEEEEDPWAKFRAMTDQVTNVVKSTEEKIKTLEETSAVKDIKDESYISQIGGTQGMLPPSVQRQIAEMEAEKKRAKEEKKMAKKAGKRAPSPTFDPKKEDDLDRAAAELAAKLATRMDMSDWRPPSEREKEGNKPPEKSGTPTKEKKTVRIDSVSSKDEGPHKNSIAVSEDMPPLSARSGPHSQLNFQVSSDSGYQPIGDVVSPGLATAVANNWAGFDDKFAPPLPTSDSDFFSQVGTFDKPLEQDPFVVPTQFDPFAPAQENLLIEDNYDPFDVRPVEDILEQAKQKAAIEAAKLEAQEDLEFFGGPSSRLSTPTVEGGSPASARPTGFEDDFRAAGPDDELSFTPLYDEDDSQPLDEWPSKFQGDGWELMLRHPLKKKLMADRVWKPCYVRLRDNMLYIFNAKQDNKPFQEIMLQATYSLSDAILQAYDAYGKIHTVKLQVVFYKERVGIRAGQITRLVEGHITKYGLPLEHAAQCTVLAKFGCLSANDLNSFTTTIEDILFRCVARREVSPIYKQDEVQIHCYDEYAAYVDKNGIVSDQKARVRMFCLAFLTGSPFLEIGLNDRRRQGKEIVRRKDILPMYTERWIRFENLDFHCTVDKKEWENEQVIKLSPLDGCFFEVMRFRVRPPKNREKPLTVKCLMKIAGSKIEIRIETMASAQQQRARGTTESIRTIPCEDIQIRFPIPEAWIYIFREERAWGVGSVHSKTRRPGKVKNLKDRIMGAVQHTEHTLIEVATGEAKYEHVHRSLVWRIPRLPEKHHAAYKSHLLKCRFDLSSFDLMPESFLPNCEVEFTMPLATISNTVVRSISVEQHEDSDRVEKFVRYVAKCQYKVEIDYVQCSDLDNDEIFEPTVLDPDMSLSTQPQTTTEHKPMFDPNEVAAQHEGYRIDLPEQTANPFEKPGDSSSDEEDNFRRPIPMIEIDMKGYGY